MTTTVLQRKKAEKNASGKLSKPSRISSQRKIEIDHDLQLLFGRLPSGDKSAISHREQDEFTLSYAQFSVGIRLAISEKDGSIRACPRCGKHRLVTIPGPFAAHELRNQETITVCADALGGNSSCGFYEIPQLGLVAPAQAPA